MRMFLDFVYVAALIVLIALIAIRSRKEGGAHPSAIRTGGSAIFHSSGLAGVSSREPCYLPDKRALQWKAL